MTPVQAPPPGTLRRTRRPFPARRHLPGGAIHPSSEGFVAVPDFAWGCDLFDHRYYWEAHEVWEAEWVTLLRTSPEARFLQGLICGAASVIKAHQEWIDPAELLAARSADHLTFAAAALGDRPRGIRIHDFIDRIATFHRDGTWPLLPDG